MPPGINAGWATADQAFTTSIQMPSSRFPKSRLKLPPETILANASKVSRGQPLSAEELIALSPVPIPGAPLETTALFIKTLFANTDSVNIVNNTNPHPDTKPQPKGPGLTMTAADWASEFSSLEPDALLPGHYWIRFNPVTAAGSGKYGSYCDVDVTRCAYCLVEFDDLPVEEQIPLFANLNLPIVAIIASGGRSVHALVRLAPQTSPEQYKEFTKKLLKKLSRFGVDESNKNPSRFTRLPGVLRNPAAGLAGMQRLLYLNPNANGTPILK
ncbi:MAG: hypothetical protein QM796_10865 [Chthoniobacteraceae bacterium]